MRLVDMVKELESSAASIERSAFDGPQLAGWLVAHRNRLATLRLALLAASRDTEILHAISTVTEAEADVVGVALGSLMQLVNAERGFVVLRGTDGELSYPAVHPAGEVRLSRTILDVALRGTTTITVHDAISDPRFAKQSSVQALALRAVLAVPITTQGQTWGAVYLDNPLRAGAFDAEAGAAAERFARILGPILAPPPPRPVEETETDDMKSAIRGFKRRLIERTLEKTAGDCQVAARLLGVHPKYFYQLMRELVLRV